MSDSELQFSGIILWKEPRGYIGSESLYGKCCQAHDGPIRALACQWTLEGV